MGNSRVRRRVPKGDAGGLGACRRQGSSEPLGQRGAVAVWRRSGSFHKIDTCQASAAAQGDRQGHQRAMPSGKIVPRSNWSAGTASRRARSRRACGRSCTCGISLRRPRLRKPRLALTTPARPLSGCASDDRRAALQGRPIERHRRSARPRHEPADRSRRLSRGVITGRRRRGS
jgi:hypothetical protein